jgi:hypothetical protein
MARMTLDCRAMPSDRNCSVQISGDESEVLDLAVRHAVDAHGHADSDELRAALREALREEAELLVEDGSFLQLIEFRTGDIGRFHELAEQWRQSIGRETTGRWALLTADRDRPDTYVQVVGFPDFAAAMRNSEHPVTTEFAKRMQEATEGEADFRNLDVREVMRM